MSTAKNRKKNNRGRQTKMERVQKKDRRRYVLSDMELILQGNKGDNEEEGYALDFRVPDLYFILTS